MKNRIRLFLFVGGILLGILVSAIIGRLGGADSPPTTAVEDKTTTGKATSWTCAMHPQIQQPNPGKCPICAMDLIPAGSIDRLGPRQYAMSEEARALARIDTVAVKRQLAETAVRLVGKVDYDETRIRTIAARFPARIERLYVDYTGIEVKEGDHLAHVYSEDLLTAQRELLVARGNPSQLGIVRDKLRLLGLPESGIQKIEETGKISDQMDIDAPTSGIVIERLISEGAYVKKGDPLFRIADLSEVWVKLDAYESDLQWVRYGQPVTFEAEALPGRTFEGTVAFLSPSLDPQTRTVKVRVNAANPDGALKPGMFVRAEVTSRLAAGGRVVSPELKDKWISPMHPEIIRDEPGNCPVCGMKLVKASELGYAILDPDDPQSVPLVIPTSAVLLTGKRAVVYVEVPETEQPTYEGREIELGPKAGDVYLVESGLKEGERVVTQGAFKIDSALQIIAKPSMMSGEGAAGIHQQFATWELSPEAYQTVLDDYLALHRALAADDEEAAKKAIATLVSNGAVKEFPPASKLTETLAAATNLAAQREVFAPLSYGMLELARRPDLATKETDLRRVHCPMAFQGVGADWLQRGDTVSNPYFGAKMRTCGTVSLIEPAAPASPSHEGHQH
ncbi:MAG: efflux RND transporter periplasmic adaptor subunit [Verrucomicrobiae bacterium]|nr:efflux RND transporter periplasmic adaptor subunit [Verrucomicrobiae bacterium]